VSFTAGLLTRVLEIVLSNGEHDRW